MTGYKQVSLTPEAHQALKRMKWALTDQLEEDLTLSQAVLIGAALAARNDAPVVEAGQSIGIEPSAHNPSYGREK